MDTPPPDPARLRAGIDWIVLIAAIAAIAITARLGWWQVTRGQTKAALHAQITQRMAEPPLALAELPQDAAGLAERLYRRVELQGEWLPEHTVYLDNRQMRGRPGFFVVTPLRLGGGDAVLVQRGWLPRHPVDRSAVPPLATEAGVVRLSGRLAPPPSRLYEFDTAASGAIRQNLDLAAHAAAIGVTLRPYSVLQLDDGAVGGAAEPAPPAGPDGAAPALLRDWPQPQADVHKHYAYALQWFLMSVVIAGLYVWFRILLPAAVTGLPVPPVEPSARVEPLSFSVHSLPEPALEQRRRTASGRLQMLLVMLVCAAPVLASYFMYYVGRPAARTAQGELIDPPRELPTAAALALRDPAGAPVDPQSLRGQWLLVVAADGSCDARCEGRLYLQRQLREMLGREKDRLDRVWLLTGSAPMRAALAPAMQQATVLGADRDQAVAWLEGRPDGSATASAGIDQSLYLVDPMGRLMMRFPATGDPGGIKRDLERVLRASASWDRAGREAP